MSLSAALEEAVRTNRLETLTLYQTSEGWQANAKRRDGGWTCVTTADPVAGLEQAVRGTLSAHRNPSKDIFE